MKIPKQKHQVIVSTEQGELYLFENFEFKCLLPASPTDGAAIYNLAVFSKGFVAGGANGVLRVYERSEDPREFFKCLKVGTVWSRRGARIAGKETDI